MAERLPEGAPGPFYVVKDECIACGAPEMEADGLMSHREKDSQCFFLRQPQTQDEIDSAIRATLASCCGAVRYGGKDKEILTRFAEAGGSEVCDYPLGNTWGRVRRNIVRFRLNSDNPSSPERTLVEISEHIGKHFIRHGNECSLDGRGMTFTWGRSVTSRGHSIRINLLQEEDGTWRISLANNERAELWTAIGIDKSLRLHSGITNIGWFETESATRPGGLLKFFPLTRAHDSGRPHPY